MRSVYTINASPCRVVRYIRTRVYVVLRYVYVCVCRGPVGVISRASVVRASCIEYQMF